MNKGDTVYAIQAGNPSAEQFGIRIVDMIGNTATLRAKYRGARPFIVTLDELSSKYTTANLTEQKAAQGDEAAASPAPQPEPKKKVTMPATPPPAPASDAE